METASGIKAFSNFLQMAYSTRSGSMPEARSSLRTVWSS